MSEQRKHPRQLILDSAKIFLDRRSPPIECGILDISESGACVLLPPNAYVPNCFGLAIDSIGAFHQCLIVWREGYEIGVEFSGPEMTTSESLKIQQNVGAASLRGGWLGRVRQ